MGTEASPDLRTIYAPVEEDMLRLAAFLETEFGGVEPFLMRILEHVSRFRGKQIRPAILFLTRRLALLPGARAGATRARPEDHVKIGAVVELIHTATLVHDDILDDAELRRGVETVHRRWGERAAILIGDYIYSHAFRLSTEVQGMARAFSDTTNTICEGELLQIGSRFRPDIGEERYLEIIRKKTGILYAAAARLGGVLGGADSDLAGKLHEFGMELGTAFQIVDDCLDYDGEEGLTGKSLGTDLRQGKVTLPLIYLREAVPEGERKWLDGALSGPIAGEPERRIQRLVAEHGVLAEAFARAQGFVESAKGILAELLGGNGGQIGESLDLVADYVLRRRQ